VAGLRSELARKAVHIGMGCLILALRWLTPGQAAAVAALAIPFNLFLLHRLTGKALLRPDERARSFSWGIALYPAVVLVLLLVFHRRLELAAACWALLAFGDGMAAVTGLSVGGPRLSWNPNKSWSGVIGFVLYGTAASAFVLRWTQRAALDSPSVEIQYLGDSFLGTTLPGAGMSDTTWLILACAVAALVAALAESLDTGLDDNIMVPLIGGLALFGMTLVQPVLVVDALPALWSGLIWGASINALLAVAAFAARGVSLSGALWGWLLGTTLYSFGGWRGFLMLLLFFVLGTVTTKLGYSRKAQLGIAQERGGRRGARNAFANASAGVLFAVLMVATPHTAIFSVGLIAAFATAACDTVSSEIGQAYGRRHFLITNFRRVPAGTDGAVSVEGTIAGVLGAAVLAIVAWVTGWIGPAGATIVVVAAFVGATLESYLGATVEGVKQIDNELVNFTNTIVGGLVAVALSYWLS